MCSSAIMITMGTELVCNIKNGSYEFTQLVKNLSLALFAIRFAFIDSICNVLTSHHTSLLVYSSYFSFVFWFSSPWHDGTALKCSIMILKKAFKLRMRSSLSLNLDLLSDWMIIQRIWYSLAFSSNSLLSASPKIHKLNTRKEKPHQIGISQFFYVNFSNATVLFPWFEIYANQTELQINFSNSLCFVYQINLLLHGIWIGTFHL